MRRELAPLIIAGILSLVVATVGVVDMFVPKTWDGITPGVAATRGDGLPVEKVAPASAAERAGIRPGDHLLGIGDRLIDSPAAAAEELLRYRIGEDVHYLIERNDQVLPPIRVVPDGSLPANPFYIFNAVVGFIFFFVGLFVLLQRSDDAAARVYALLCFLFLVFLVCRLRPGSYYWIDFFVERAGTLALFLLPAVFLHFFLIFPERKRFHLVSDDPEEEPSRLRRELDRLINERRFLFGLLYALPPAAYLSHLLSGGGSSRLLFGAPAINWVLLGNYMLLGLVALGHSWVRAADARRRRQILPVLLGSVFGTAPLILFGVVLPALTGETGLVAFGTVPLVLIPLTFGYAIVRYQLLNVRLVVRKGLLYAVTTAVVTGLYALAIVGANRFLERVGGSSTAAFVLGVLVVLAFDPLRRRLQQPVDRIFFRDRVDFARAIHEMSEAVRTELSLDRIRELMTVRVIEVTRAAGGCLLLPDAADPDRLRPSKKEGTAGELPCQSTLGQLLRETGTPRRVDSLRRLGQDADSASFLAAAEAEAVRLLVPLVYRSKLQGLLLLERKLSEEEYSREELDVLSTLANQAAVALETARLHAESTRQVELARDLEIAREIQMSLFPRELPEPPGIELHGDSIPARVVGGDFYDAFLLGEAHHQQVGLLLGDVSGKSIPGALLMVASREILHAVASPGKRPADVFREAGRRIYAIKRRMFVALGYYVLDARNRRLRYSIAGMPTPLLCRRGEGRARPIPVPQDRMPLGGLRDVPYDDTSLDLEEGDLLLFYSDGLTEALDSSGEFFGEERLASLLWHLRDDSLEEIGRELSETVRRFAADVDSFDDMTFLLLRVSAPSSGDQVVEG